MTDRVLRYTAAAMDAVSPERTLPIFPLTGTLLLPGTYLPLNIFEERYRNMVRDALAADRRIGMVQPVVPGLDNWGVPPLDLEAPELYPVGCCGRMTEHEQQPDGRCLIVLEGVVRFRIIEELRPLHGYRRVRANSVEFADDLRLDEPSFDRHEILSVLDAFARQRELEFDSDLLAALPARRLVNTLSTALPFSPAEQQALLEARTAATRAALLLTLMGIDLDSTPTARAPSPPTIH